MRRGIIAVVMYVALILPLAAGAADNPWEKKLPFKSAVIRYELSGMETGEEMLYIRKHGQETARHHSGKTTMFGMSTNTRTVQITTPDWVYQFDLEERTGSKSVNPQKLMIEEYEKLSSAEKKQVQKNAEQMGTSMMNGMQGSIEKDAKEILGYSCDKATFMGSTVYSIHDTPIVLFSDTNIMGMKVKSVATSIEEGKVDDKYFAFPEGIEPQPNPDADRMAKMMAQQTMAALKDPDGFKQKTPSQNQPASSDTASQSAPESAPQDGQSQEAPSAEEQAVEQTMKVLKGLFGN